MSQSPPPSAAAPPLVSGFLPNVRFNALSGFLVFLIALPLCLAIAQASNVPPVAGLMTAVIGGIVCVFVSDSELTIKGPAAGLIAIVAECVTQFAKQFGAGLSESDALFLGYRLTLGVGLAAGVVQVVFGLFRVGKLSDFFPLAAVHGMLASIGVMIISKQLYHVFGIPVPKGNFTPLRLLAQFPLQLPNLDPEITCIGLVSLTILFSLMFVKNKHGKMIPGPMVVLLVALPLGRYFDLEHEHTYLFPDRFFDAGHEASHTVGPRFLVDMPNILANPLSALTLPRFEGLLTLTGLRFLVMFAVVGSLESLLSAKAIDLLDPWKRKTNTNLDLLAVGVANTIAAALGGLPMISEIVRSSANINNGARTRWANFFHGLFLLAFAVLMPDLLHMIPLSALGAMLVFTGVRLASPKEFATRWGIGREQLAVFLATVLVTLSTDLLMGIFAGTAMAFAFHLYHGAPVKASFVPPVEIELLADGAFRVTVAGAAVFTNWIGLKAKLDTLARNAKVVLDLSETRLVDHTVMDKLHELEGEFARRGCELHVVGLDQHEPMSAHPLAARRRRVDGTYAASE